MEDKVEIITVYRGKDYAVYLGSEYRELGDRATPIKIYQDPRSGAPWREMKMEDADALAVQSVPKEPLTESSKWDLKVLQKLLSEKGEE